MASDSCPFDSGPLPCYPFVWPLVALSESQNLGHPSWNTPLTHLANLMALMVELGGRGVRVNRRFWLTESFHPFRPPAPPFFPRLPVTALVPLRPPWAPHIPSCTETFTLAAAFPAGPPVAASASFSYQPNCPLLREAPPDQPHPFSFLAETFGSDFIHFFSVSLAGIYKPRRVRRLPCLTSASS